MPHLTILLLTGSHMRRHSLTHFIPTRRSSHPQILRLSLPHLPVTDLDSPTPLTNTDPHTITPSHLNVLPCPLHTRLILGHSHADATKTHTHTLAQTHESFLRKTHFSCQASLHKRPYSRTVPAARDSQSHPGPRPSRSPRASPGPGLPRAPAYSPRARSRIAASSRQAATRRRLGAARMVPRS